MSPELVVDATGQTLSGDIDQFIDSLMTGGRLVFRAASNASPVANSEEGFYGSEALVESFRCRTFLVVPEHKYFAGVLGPLHCAVQRPDKYIPLQHFGQPIYYYQAADCHNNQSVRYFFTHPEWPERPTRTDSYSPLKWLSQPVFEKALHVDEHGAVLSDSEAAIKKAVLAGKRHHVLIKNLYKEIVATGFDCDYWFGFDLDLVQYYPEKNTATAQVSETIIATVQSPFVIDDGQEVSLLISSTGQVSLVIRTGYRTETVKTTFYGQEKMVGYEMRCHLTEGELVHRQELIWFVEK